MCSENKPMEILNIGSFVPLDNRERIEQLKFTAREIASEAAKSDGFENTGPTNQQFALEMWKGAEYMCRAHEENTVRNIFLSSFLERLRDLAKATRIPLPPQPVQSLPSSVPESAPAVVANVAPLPVVPTVVELPAPAVIETPPQLSNAPAPDAPNPAEATDEFLGIIPSMEDIPPESTHSSYADECVPGYDPAIEALVDKLENEAPSPETCESPELVETISEDPATAPVDSPSQKDSAPDSPAPTDPVAGEEVTEEKSEAEAEVVEPSEAESIESIVIAEKEPYNFDSCTVTSVVQLLPENDGIRKCVVSVRSHDFVPQITISEVATGNIADDIKRGLERAFEQYRTDLPALAAEKIKKEKPAAKKRTSKPAEKGKTAGKAIEQKSTAASHITQSSEAAQGQNSLFAS